MLPPVPRFIGLGLLLGTLSSAGAALACSIAVHPLQIADDPLDVKAPGTVSDLRVHDIQRGIGPDCDASGTCSQSSCDDLGFVQLQFTPPADDRTATDDLGYVTWVEQGSPPDHDGALELEDPLVALVDKDTATLSLHWIDGATDAQQAIDVVLAVAAVDASGRQGPPAFVHIRDAARDTVPSTGCAHAGSAPLGIITLSILGLVLGGRRRSAP